MKEMSRLDEFRRATAAAKQRAAADRAALDAASNRPAEPGDVYLFPGDGDAATRWAVIAAHPDRTHLLFAVPADGHPLFGLADVPTQDDTSRLTLRCGLGLWLPREEFTAARRVRVLGGEPVRRAMEKMRQILSGKLEGPEAARESEANPDYRAWMGVVAAAVDRLAAAVRSGAVVLEPSDFRAALPTFRPVEDEAPQMSLAAESPDMLETAPAPPPAAPPACRVDLLYPGELFLLLEANGVGVLYRSDTANAPPPVFRLEGPDNWRPLTWARTPGGKAARASAAWVGDSVRLRFGEGPSNREVTVSRP